MPRNKELSGNLREFIKTRYLFFGENSRNIANYINNNEDLRKKYGEVTHSSIEYHITFIKKELDSYLSEDVIDNYQADFYRTQKKFEQEEAELNKWIEEEQNDDRKLRLVRFRHELRIDAIKHITDARLPLAIAKFKKEREKWNTNSKRLPSVSGEISETIKRDD